MTTMAGGLDGSWEVGAVDLRSALTTSLTPRRRVLDFAAVGGGRLAVCLEQSAQWEERCAQSGRIGVDGKTYTS